MTGRCSGEAVAGLGAGGEGVGVKLPLQMIGACDGDDAISGDVLPAIGKRARNIDSAEILSAIDAELEQVGVAAAPHRFHRASGFAREGTPSIRCSRLRHHWAEDVFRRS